MAAPKQKILICTYYWPPSGGSGVQRWLYFAHHLQALGWEAIVLTVDEAQAAYPERDNSLLTLTKGIRVYRTPTREPLRFYSRWFSKNGIPKGAVPQKTFMQRIAAWIRGNLFIPDARKGWVPFALRQARELLATESISHVVTTGPPHSTHLIGTALKNEFKLHWTADFRDPWTDLFYNKAFYRSSYAQKKDARLEKTVLENADAVLTTIGDTFHKSLQNKVHKKIKLYALPNGYDAEMMAQIKPQKPKTFHLVFTGLLTPNQAYRTLLSALQGFCKAHPKTTIRWSLAGSVTHAILQEMKAALPNVELHYLGYLPHAKAVALMKSAHLLVNFIFEGAHQQMLSGKLLEYLATQNPILSLGDPQSPAGTFLAQATHAKMIHPLNQEAIIAFISTAFKEKESLKNHFPQLEQWSRKALTQRLVEEVLLTQ
ncbi:MAG: hypothetical protein ACPGVF_07020 [Flavobacteriaceae bacterium]